jgi:outer membrane biosynthesis protein TonB
MQEIVKRVWREPAVAIGLLTSIALAIIVVVSGDSWDLAAITGVAAPLVSALGIRSQVTPTAKAEPEPEPAKPPPEPEPTPEPEPAPTPDPEPPPADDESDITPGDPTA